MKNESNGWAGITAARELLEILNFPPTCTKAQALRSPQVLKAAAYVAEIPDGHYNQLHLQLAQINQERAESSTQTVPIISSLLLFFKEKL